MQQSFVQETEINLLDIDLTGKTLNQLGEIALQALSESLGLARRSVESAWFAGKVLDRAKIQTKHGQWGEWLDSRGIGKDTAARVMKVYREYEISQLAKFDSMSAALRMIPAKPKPEPVEPVTNTPKPEPKAGQTVIVKDISTGEMVEREVTPQPTSAQQIYAYEGREQPIDTSQGVHKEREKVQEWEPKTHRLRFRKSKAGIEIKDDIALGDDVTMTGYELFYLLKNFPIIGTPPGESVVIHAGETI